ncbi:hypothetical protein [Cuspidothrix issatschenkoi]|uniref:Uncharacterized protein n=1 Tax=Cuspidothrix issatschenkoi CHARLIE-1 TaxID=2052836 RepID=A0A2S6CZX2_9CYAN|nr:hypothetical protein [Cuspidothrix issatschenkoi]PPJ65257.1 hypothetical protein CUN59_00380 [Cuspidothrix issatschenkoi CHARLIE-1]
MRTYEIKRRESGRFFLLSIFGTGRNFQQQEWDLAHDTNESKVMLQEMFKSIRPEELPLEDRDPLIDSVSEQIPIPKSITSNGNPKTARTLPSDPVHHSITFRLPRCN